MSRFFPKADYAEDQPWSHTILTGHVLLRAATSGSIVGAGVLGARLLAERFLPSSPSTSSSLPTSSSTIITAAKPPPTIRLLRASGTGVAVALPLLALALAGRMRGREEIEWRDRAYRLLYNRGQVETDDWTLAGAVAGVAAVVFLPAARARVSLGVLGWRGVLGAAAGGSAVGVGGYVLWRYGVRGGRFPGEV